jgi:L-histidine N-alpha-methyltransferase
MAAHSKGGESLASRIGPSPPRGDAIRRTGRAERALTVMATEVRAGLLRRPLLELPCKYFYDDRGSALFERITELPEYYPTRVETAILEAHAAAVVEAVTPVELVELGSGSGRKIRLFLDAMRRGGRLESVVLLEINPSYLHESVSQIQADYPEAGVRGIVGDFVHDLEALGPGGGRLLLFLAGTIGNLHPDEVPAFFRAAAAVLAPGDGFLVGVDLVKDPARLHAAYNDAAGVTAEFNLNILRVVNERLDGDFDLSAFEHVAFYDRRRQWIEMRLRARRPVRARVRKAGVSIALEAGQEIRTELSCKYTRESLSERLAGTGLRLERWITDPEALFASVLLRRDGDSRPGFRRAGHGARILDPGA